MADTPLGVQNSVAGDGRSGVNITWNDENIDSKYANIATVTATREEFFFLFGTHQNWRGIEDGKSIEVKLSTRMVLNPYATKRLMLILQQTMNAYESRFGEVKL